MTDHYWTTWETVVAATDVKPVAIYRRLKPTFRNRYDWRVVRANVETYAVTVDSERSARAVRREMLR